MHRDCVRHRTNTNTSLFPFCMRRFTLQGHQPARGSPLLLSSCLLCLSFYFQILLRIGPQKPVPQCVVWWRRPLYTLVPHVPGGDHGAWCSPHMYTLNTTRTHSTPHLWLPHDRSSVLGAWETLTPTTLKWLLPFPQHPHAKGQKLDMAQGDMA